MVPACHKMSLAVNYCALFPRGFSALSGNPSQHNGLRKTVGSDLKSLDGNVVRVRVPPPAPTFERGITDQTPSALGQALTGLSIGDHVEALR